MAKKEKRDDLTVIEQWQKIEKIMEIFEQIPDEKKWIALMNSKLDGLIYYTIENSLTNLSKRKDLEEIEKRMLKFLN